MDWISFRKSFDRKMICFILFFWYSGNVVFSQETIQATEKLHGRIHKPDDISFVEMLGGTTKGLYSIVKWKYHILIDNYDPTVSTPILYFRHSGQQGYDSQKHCFEGKEFMDLYSYDPRLVPLQKYSRVAGLDKECVVKNNVLNCSGTLKFATSQQVQWYVSVGFQCGQERSLDLMFSLTLTAYNKVACNPINHAFESLEGAIPLQLFAVRIWCSQYSANYSSFNAIGFNDYDFFRAIQIRSRALDLKCYQYVPFLLCGYLLPYCENGEITLPCIETCEDFKQGCQSLGDVIVCNGLISKDSGKNCSYQAVECGPYPNITEHAEVTFANGSTAGSIVEMNCKKGYIPDGEPIVRCAFSGEWVYDDNFKCMKEIPKPPVVMISSVCTSIIVVLMIIFTIFGVTYKVELKILSRKYVSSNPCGKPQIVEPKCYHACFSYHVDCYDCEENVRGIKGILDPLGYKTYTYFDDVRYGQSAVSRIPEVVSKSYRVIILLNQHFLNSDWCSYELENSFIQWIEDKKFDLVIILTEKKISLTNVPRYLRAYLRLNMYLESSDPKLLPKLQQCLPCPSTSRLVPESPYYDDEALIDPNSEENEQENDELIELN